MKLSSLLRVLGAAVGLSLISAGPVRGQSAHGWDPLVLNGIFNVADNWIGDDPPGDGDFVSIVHNVSFTGPVTPGDRYTTFDMGAGTRFFIDAPFSTITLRFNDTDVIVTQNADTEIAAILMDGGQYLHQSGNLIFSEAGFGGDGYITIKASTDAVSLVQIGGTAAFSGLKILSTSEGVPTYEQKPGAYVYGLQNMLVGGGGEALANLTGGTLKVANYTPITIGWIDQNTDTPDEPIPGKQARLTLSGDAILLLGNAAEEKYTGLDLATHQDATLTVGGDAQLHAEGALVYGGAGVATIIQTGGTINFDEDLSLNAYADASSYATITQSGGTAEYRDIVLESPGVNRTTYTLSGGTLTANSINVGTNGTFTQSGGTATVDLLHTGVFGATDSLVELSGGTTTVTGSAGAGHDGVLSIAGGTLNTATLYLVAGGEIEYLFGTLNAQSLNFNGGTFNLAQNRALNVSGDGLVKNTLTFAASNTLDLGGELRLFGGTFNTAGTVELGSLLLEEGATYTQTGGTATVTDGVELASGSALTVSGGSFTAGGALVLDDGVTGNVPGGSTLGVSGGASFTTGAATFNRGTAVTLGSGTQTFNGAVNVYGTLTLDSGSDVTAGDMTVGRSYSGTLQFNAGLLDVAHLDIVNTANLYGGTLTADQFTVRAGGAIDWTSTQATVSGDALIGGTVTMSNGQLNAASLALNATDAAFTQSAGTVAITGESRLNANTALNRTGGTFGTGSFVFTGGNASFTQSAGSLTTGSLDITQLASATFALSGGTLRATGNASIFGSGNAGGNDFTVSNNAFLDIDGNLTVSGATEIVTSGTARVDVGGSFRVAQGGGEDVRLTLGAGTTLSNGTAELGGNGKVSVTLNGLHDVDGAFTLGGASGPQSIYLIQSSGELRADSVTLAPVSGSSARLDVGGTLAVDGAVQIGAAGGGAGTLRLTTGVINADSLTSYGGTTVAQLGGVMNVTGTLDNGGSYTLGGAAINAGTFVNNNTVTVSSGAAVNTLTGDLTNNALFMINSTLTVDKTSAAISNTGTILLDHGAQLSFYPGATLHNNQGVLGGIGTIGGVSATILDEGYLAPGYGPNETTRLTIVGDYTLLAGGHLEIDIASLTSFDSVHFQNSTPEFYGWLDVNFADGFDAVLGDTFDIITGTAAFTTLFRDITTTGLDSGLALSGTDLGTTFRLTVIEAMTSGGGSGGSPSPVPEPSTWSLLLGLAAVGIVTCRRRRSGPHATNLK